MEENESVVEDTSVIVNVDNVTMDSTQYEALFGSVQSVQADIQTLNGSVVHATSFLILLCIFQLYGLISRSRKKAGVR